MCDDTLVYTLLVLKVKHNAQIRGSIHIATNSSIDVAIKLLILLTFLCINTYVTSGIIILKFELVTVYYMYICIGYMKVCISQFAIKAVAFVCFHEICMYKVFIFSIQQT